MTPGANRMEVVLTGVHEARHSLPLAVMDGQNDKSSPAVSFSGWRCP